MPLIKPFPPPETRQALNAGITNFVSSRDALGRILAQGQLGFNVFTIENKDLSQPDPLRTAKEIGWRFYAGAPGGPSLAADVMAASEKSPAVMTSLSRDKLISSAIEAIYEVEALADVQNDIYELRALRLAGILVEAFWLKSATGKEDLIVPVLLRCTELQKMHAYRTGDFFQIAGHLATQFIEFDGTGGAYIETPPSAE